MPGERACGQPKPCLHPPDRTSAIMTPPYLVQLLRETHSCGNNSRPIRRRSSRPGDWRGTANIFVPNMSQLTLAGEKPRCWACRHSGERHRADWKTIPESASAPPGSPGKRSPDTDEERLTLAFRSPSSRAEQPGLWPKLPIRTRSDTARNPAQSEPSPRRRGQRNSVLPAAGRANPGG